jgi:hypothetical protein
MDESRDVSAFGLSYSAKRLDGPAAGQASALLHHLLNQSLSGLDFCILWQELAQEHPQLAAADAWVRRFLDTAELSALDRALALLPEPEEGQRLPDLALPASWKDDWSMSSRRLRDVTRVEFRCPVCGWEIAYSMEHPANTEMRLPFEQLDCPLCVAEP